MITSLKQLADASEQDVFDTVATHLLTQGRPARRPTGECAYLAPNGERCAAGCLIAHDEHNPDWEGEDWYSLAARGFVPYAHSHLVSALQRLHDCSQPSEWRARLRSLASEHELDPSVLDTFAKDAP